MLAAMSYLLSTSSKSKSALFFLYSTKYISKSHLLKQLSLHWARYCNFALHPSSKKCLVDQQSSF